MKEETKRESFVLHTEQKEIFDKLSNEQAGILIKAIYQYVEDGIIPSLDLTLELAFLPFKNNIDNYTKQAKSKKNKDNSKVEDEEIDKYNFEQIWKVYPRKKGKASSYTSFLKFVNDGKKIDNVKYKLDAEQIAKAVIKYAKECEENKTEERYIMHGSTFFNGKILDYIDEQEE